MPGAVWPAILDGPAADMLGLQFQFLHTERLPAEDLAAAQWAQLSALVEYCARTMPFHRDRLQAAGFMPTIPPSPATFARLPVLTRAEAVQLGAKLHGLSLPGTHGPTLRGTVPDPLGRPFTIVASRVHAFFNDAYLLRDLLWRETDFRGKWARLSHDPATVTAGARGTRERDWGRR
jgi:phenylacetate-CoA ligase